MIIERPINKYPDFFRGSFSMKREQIGYEIAYVAPSIIWEEKILMFNSEIMTVGPMYKTLRLNKEKLMKIKFHLIDLYRIKSKGVRFFVTIIKFSATLKTSYSERMR